MRRKIALIGLGFGLAASFANVSPASAICLNQLAPVGICNPCDPVNAVLVKYGTHLDCIQ